jgi:hypothetical protein
MAARSPVRRRLSSTVAAVERHTPDSPALPALRAELAAAGLEEHIRRVVAAAPPLTQAQRNQLAIILLDTGHAG